jgi:uncharacterized protein involved in type VI secretion and phage assembly
MIDCLSNAIKAHAANLDTAAAQAKFGIVASVNGQTQAARVVMQPDGVLSGWLPFLSPWTGSGWGIVCPLSPGDQVFVVPQEGDIEQGVIVGRAYSTAQRPPQAPSGEFWIVHQSGSSLKLCNDGTVRVAGDLHVQGNVFDSQGSLSRLRGAYNSHTHPGAQGGTTGVPNQPDDTSC